MLKLWRSTFFSSLLFSSLLFPSLPFTYVLFSSFPFPSLCFPVAPSLPFSSLRLLFVAFTFALFNSPLVSSLPWRSVLFSLLFFISFFLFILFHFIVCLSSGYQGWVESVCGRNDDHRFHGKVSITLGVLYCLVFVDSLTFFVPQRFSNFQSQWILIEKKLLNERMRMVVDVQIFGIIDIALSLLFVAFSFLGNTLN